MTRAGRRTPDRWDKPSRRYHGGAHHRGGDGLLAIGTRIALPSQFTMDLQDAIETGVGKMAASDLDVETTPLKAPQTQEHLEIQAP